MNVKPNVNDIAAAGDDGADDTDAPGGVTSMFIVGAAVSPPGPSCDETLPSTAFCSKVRITVPLVGDALDTVTTYVVPDPVNPVTDQPELVPDMVKSDVVRSVTDSEKTMS